MARKGAGRIGAIKRKRRERKQRWEGIRRARRKPGPPPEWITSRPGYAAAVRRVNERDRAIGAGGDIMAVIRDPEGREAIASLSGGSGVEERRERRRRLKAVGDG